MQYPPYFPLLLSHIPGILHPWPKRIYQVFPVLFIIRAAIRSELYRKMADGDGRVKYISLEELEHMYDPVAQIVWKKWLRAGKAELVEKIEQCEDKPEDICRGGIY
jgi:hypothetical protein